MKIGIDCRMYSPKFTGIGRYVYELTNNLFKFDTQNDYIFFFNEPEYSRFEPPDPRIKKILVNANHYSIKEQTKFLQLINKEKLDLMHFTHFNAPIFYSRPSVVTIHDLTLSFYPGKKMTSPVHRLAYNLTLKTSVKKAKKVIAVSNNTKKDLQNLLNTPSNKIEVIYEGVNEKFKILKDKSAIKKIKDKYGITKPYLLYTGVWRSHKNLPNLIKAFHILKDKYKYNYSLVVTGRKDPLYAPDIIEEAIKLNIDNDIIFTELVNEADLIVLYNGALAYVFPSFYEGFGLPPLEAMRCGIPVIASSSSCIPEVCGENNTVYFNPNSPSEMAEKIHKVINKPELQEKLIKNGLEHVKKFSWQKMAETTHKIYKDILNN